MKINIIGINKGIVLFALYLKAIEKGPTTQNPTPNIILTLAIAATKEFDKRSSSMDFNFNSINLGLGDMPLKVDLSRLEFDADEFDNMYGEGSAKEAIDTERQRVIDAANATNDPTLHKLAEVLIKIQAISTGTTAKLRP